MPMLKPILKPILRQIFNAPKQCLLLFLKGYKLLISPMLGQPCRFYPSCGSYGIEAVHTHGALKGCYLILKRLARCHPLNEGGYDPVPQRHHCR